MPAPTIRLISSMATREVLGELAAKFSAAGHGSVACESVGGVDAAKRVQAGEVFDLVVLAANAINQLMASGRVVAGSRVDLMRSGIALAVPAGAPAPDIASEESVKRAVLAARTLAYSTGPSGVYLTQLFERWGILQTVQPRLVQAPPGVPVGSLVARGEVELGFQQLSELMHLPGITVLGPLPAEIQSITTFSAGICGASSVPEAARALVDFMNLPAAAVVKRRYGMDPA